ncbi:MAG: alpha/beta fold hydrolase [Burkholderiales bacterium]
MTHLLPTSDLPIVTVDAAAALEAAATRIETPCGDSQSMVWHVWGTGKPVVLLHGGSGSWNHWVRNIAPLALAGFQVLVPDLPGFGDSARPPNGHDADALPEWIEAGLSALVGTQACELVGFSFGGMVAGFLAAQWPARARQLILVGAPALMDDPGRQLGLKMWKHLPLGAERDAAIQHNLLALMLSRTPEPLALALHEANLGRDRMPRRRLSKTDILRRTLAQVQCPVFGIWGALDALYRGRIEWVQQGLEAAPQFQSLTLIENAGHWVQFEEADSFNIALLRVLSDDAD